MKRMMVVIVALMALFFVVPVQAQDVAPEQDQLLMIDGTALTVGGAILLGVLFVFVALLVLLRDSTAKLANSAPPWMEPTLMTFAGILESMVKATPTKVDDDLVLIIRKEIAAALEKRGAADMLDGLVAQELQTVPVVDVPAESPVEG